MAICWISSYPKSGNTWFRAFLTNYLQNCSAPASFNALLGRRWASQRRWIDSVLGFDSSLLSFEEFDVLRPAVYAWEGQSAGIQYHKVHEYFRRTSEGKPLFAGPGIYGCIYIARNPLDVAVSYAHHTDTTIDNAIGVMKDPNHMIRMIAGKYSPHACQYIGTWSQNVETWTANSEIATHTVRYEDMSSKPWDTFKSVLTFLGIEVIEAKLESAIRFSSFHEMQKQETAERYIDKPPGMRRFFREGRPGGWKKVLTDSQIRRVIESHASVMRSLSYI